MNEHERTRIAAAMNHARPDWPTKQLTTLLAHPQLAERPRRDVFVALAWVACESGTSSPYRVLEAGPWWRAAGVEGTTQPREQVPPHLRCSVCSQARERCAQLQTGNPELDHEFEPATADRKRPPDAMAAIVEELRGRKEPPRPVVEPEPVTPDARADVVRAEIATAEESA